MISDPKIEQRAEQPYVGIRSKVSMDQLGSTIPPLEGEISSWLNAKGIEPAGAIFWRYLVIDMDNDLVIDFGVPVATPVTGEGRIIAEALPAGTYVTTRYIGHPDGLMQATADLLAWGSANGIEWDKWQEGVTGEGWKSRIEIYFDDPDDQPDMTQWVTELAFKVADTSS